MSHETTPQTAEQYAADFAQRVRDRRAASDSVAVSLGMEGADREQYANRFIHAEDKVILILASQVQSLQEELQRATSGTRWYVPAYRADNGNVVPFGMPTVIADHAVERADEWRAQDGEVEGGHDPQNIFVATRISPVWEEMPRD